MKKYRTKEEILEFCENFGMVGKYKTVHEKTEFKCKCGHIFEARPHDILTGNTKSCGCVKLENIHKAKYKGGKYITGLEFAQIRRNAKKRNLEFNITIQDIEEIFEKQNISCAMTGDKLVFNTYTTNGDASVDRIDSTKGYYKDNIQIIHKRLNWMKGSCPDEEFINICKKIAKFKEN